MSDPTEPIRRQRLAEINAEPGSREALEAECGDVWSTQELGADFDVLGFAVPLDGDLEQKYQETMRELEL